MDIDSMTREQLIETIKNDRFFKEARQLREQMAKANELVKELESENANGNAAIELLIWWAQKLSNAPNENLKDVIKIGYRRILNLASVVGDIQLRKEGE